MLRILYKQPVHIWQTLEKRHKLEAIILFVLIYAFLATRLHVLFNKGLDGVFSASQLSTLISQVFILQISLSAVFIIAWLLPRLENLRLFLAKPLKDKELYKILFYYNFKYLSLYIILFLPVQTALLFSVGMVHTLLGMAEVVLVSSFFLLFFFFLKQRFSAAAFLFLSLATITVYVAILLAVTFLLKPNLIVFQMIILLLSATASFIFYNKSSKKGLENFTSYVQKVYHKADILAKSIKIPRFLPAVIQALFEKELLGYWRNPHYKKLKIYSFVIFTLLNSLIVLSDLESKIIGLTIVTSLLIWAHYSNSFNEKYIYPDPAWLIRTKPIRFRQLLMAKYFAEIPFVIVLLLTLFIFMQLAGAESGGQISALVFIILFAHFVLFSMLNFQIMFYNDPRLAGYAYNFTLLFIVIMILNYRLTGPIIGLALISFFLYKNVKYFSE